MGDSGHEEEGEEDEEDEIESEAQRHQSDMEDSDEADSENEEVDHESDKDGGEKVPRNGVRGSDGELVKLPCDLPSWDAIRGHLEQLAG